MPSGAVRMELSLKSQPGRAAGTGLQPMKVTVWAVSSKYIFTPVCLEHRTLAPVSLKFLELPGTFYPFLFFLFLPFGM